jgi:hypothetical protein
MQIVAIEFFSFVKFHFFLVKFLVAQLPHGSHNAARAPHKARIATSSQGMV